MTPGSSQPPTSPCIYKSVYLEVIVALYYNNRGGVIHACDLWIITHIDACVSSKANVLEPSRVQFSTAFRDIYLRDIFCISVFLVAAMHA